MIFKATFGIYANENPATGKSLQPEVSVFSFLISGRLVYYVYRRAPDKGSDILNGDLHKSRSGFQCSPCYVWSYNAVLLLKGIVFSRRFNRQYVKPAPAMMPSLRA